MPVSGHQVSPTWRSRALLIRSSGGVSIPLAVLHDAASGAVQVAWCDNVVCSTLTRIDLPGVAAHTQATFTATINGQNRLSFAYRSANNQVLARKIL